MDPSEIQIFKSDFFLSETSFPLRGFFFDQKDTPFHKQEFMEIVFILSGSASHYTRPAGWHETREGDVWCIPQNGIHAYRVEKEMQIFNLLFLPQKLPFPLLDLYRHPAYQNLVCHREEYWYRRGQYPCLKLNKEQMSVVRSMLETFSLFEEGQTLGRHGGKYGCFLAIVSYLCDLYLPYISPSPSSDLMMTNILHYINENFMYSITLNDLIRLTNMSESALRQFFHEKIGCAPNKYIQHFRIKVASRLLIETTLSVKEIAVQCGFNNENYFCRIFRSFYKMTPMDFRHSGKRRQLKN